MALYRTKGQPLVRPPITSNDEANNRSRGIQQRGLISVQHALSICNTSANVPALYLGNIHSGLLFGIRMAESLGMDYAVIVSNGYRDICLNSRLGEAWTYDEMQQQLPEGNGMLFLPTDMLTRHAAAEMMQKGNWSDHYLILVLGNGFMMDEALESSVSGFQMCSIVTDNLLTARTSAVSADHLLDLCAFWAIENAGGSAEVISNKLKTFDKEKVTNSFGINMGRGENGRIGRHHELSLTLNQSSVIEESPILSAQQIRNVNEQGLILLYGVSFAIPEVCRLDIR